MIEIIGGLWAAGETKTFHINGQYLEILDAQYPCDVLLMDKTGAQLSVMRSSEASFFSRPAEGFSSVQITSAQAQAIRVFVGSGDAGTRRISSTVQVVDGGRARTIAGVAFMGANGAAPVAAQFGQTELYNPAASGKRLIVKSYSVALSAAGAFAVGYLNGTIPNPVVPKSKLPTGAAGVATLRSQTQGVSSIVAPPLDYGFIPASSTFVRTLQEPIVLPEGWGLLIEAAAVNVQLNTGFEWIEESLS